MEIEKIRKKAIEFGVLNNIELNKIVLELKKLGVSFLGCVAFVQTNQKLTLSEAVKNTLELDCWTGKEKEQFIFSIRLMMSEFEEDAK